MYDLRGGKRLTVKRLSATAGFLEECAVEFSPQLTCVIGARGTCKSTLVESLRFALNADETKLQRLTATGKESGVAPDGGEGMLVATLGPGTVRCRVEVTDGGESTQFDVERELGGSPRVYEEGVREFADTIGSFSIEVLSQGDLQELAGESGNDRRLALIDRPYQQAVVKFEQERSVAGKRLEELGKKRRSLHQAVQSLRVEVQTQEMVRSQLAALELNAPKPSPELERELARYDARKAAVASSVSASSKLTQLQQELRRLPLESLRVDVVSLLADLESLQIDVDSADGWTALLGFVETLQQLLAESSSHSLDVPVADIAAAVEKLNEPYYQLRAEENQVNEVLKQTAVLRRQLDLLERRAIEMRECEAELRLAISERAELRSRLSAIDSELYELRSSEIEKINSEHHDTVLLSLTVEQSSAGYARLLNELLQGSRIRDQPAVAEQLARALGPADLIDVVEGVRAQELSEMLERDLGQSARLLAHLNEHARLYEIEAVPPVTRLDITFYDGESAKPVESLSRGQKATALLPIVLRSLPYPLVIDQPEDDLDNKFIFSFLVRAIQDLRTKRQLIFVTHNANIPVLGDADQVVVMRMATPSKAASPLQGSVEACKPEILDLLEGGAKAFSLREHKYGDLLE